MPKSYGALPSIKFEGKWLHIKVDSLYCVDTNNDGRMDRIYPSHPSYDSQKIDSISNVVKNKLGKNKIHKIWKSKFAFTSRKAKLTKPAKHSIRYYS